MKSRVFIAALAGLSASAWPTALMVQPASGVRRLGILMGIANDATGHALLGAFEQRLRDLGWTASGNIRVDYRWGAGDAEKAGKLANELVELQPDVIVLSNDPIVSRVATGHPNNPHHICAGFRSGR